MSTANPFPSTSHGAKASHEDTDNAYPEDPLSNGVEERTSKDFGTDTIRPPPPAMDPDGIHTLSQRGDIHSIIEKYKLDPTIDLSARDNQDVTPLHWAAINAHIGVCRWLLDNGADVDAIGGELKATPLQWAARNGHLYVIHLLMSRGADPNILDSQGFNTLHLITHSSAVMPLLYMLHQPVAIDEKDTDGHTALMWAAYQGDAISVDLLLRHGASVQTTDNAGLSPLHWAAVKGSKMCIKHLVEAGADLELKEAQGKTPRDMAEELKSTAPFEKGLQDAGYNSLGQKRIPRLSERNTNLVIFIIPTIVLGCVFRTISIFPIYIGWPLAAIEFLGMQLLVIKVLLAHHPEDSGVSASPHFAAIILSSIFWVGWEWSTKLFLGTPGHGWASMLFVISLLGCSWNFYRAIVTPAGYVPKAENDTEVKMWIEELVDAGRLNGTNFCIECMAKKALRSKHCRICQRCTARFDHHCPWIWNCVGSKNHRNFLAFVLFLVCGIITFDHLSVQFIIENAPEYIPEPEIGWSICDVSSTVCQASRYDPHLLAVAFWATLQLSWTSILVVSQLWQVARQMTTFEVTNLGRYGYMGGRGGTSLRDQSGAMRQAAVIGAGVGPTGAGEEAVMETGTDLPASGGVGGHDHGVGHGGHGGHGHQHQHGVVGCLKGLCKAITGPLCQVLGLDRFTKGKSLDGMKKAGTGQNPFDLGVLKNCQDFWIPDDSIDYTRLYEMPPNGWKQYRQQAAMSKSRTSIKGYEPVSREEV